MSSKCALATAAAATIAEVVECAWEFGRDERRRVGDVGGRGVLLGDERRREHLRDHEVGARAPVLVEVGEEAERAARGDHEEDGLLDEWCAWIIR